MPSGVVKSLEGRVGWSMDDWLGSPMADLYLRIKRNVLGLTFSIVNHRIIKLALCPDFPSLVEEEPSSRLFTRPTQGSWNAAVEKAAD